ncbi:hypothetical protein [Gimesia aquarii]|uniref:HEAT repeat protein n=1 Tax=Gimesia aquarii TaxID=2527964 RepID=A0A517VQG2_9PLAN|nr:hypothetical protein [Gimesia aquarii]QDT95264.1 hypothetical protein V144x_07060 [Gimesia aquarii]
MDEWENLTRQYASGSQDEAVRVGRCKLQRADESDWQWLADALKDPMEKWFVAAIFRGCPVPKRFVETMLRAAIHEVDPDSNRQFILPCVESFGHRKVNEFLLNVVEGDDDVEIAGAVAALYWANMQIQFTDNVPQLTLDYATPESRKEFLALNDVWERKRETFLRVFVNNYNVSIRQRIIPSLNLDESAYPDELKPLVQHAIEIARNHSDEYIRHRVEVQLGNERLLRPIPNRRPPAIE